MRPPRARVAACVLAAAGVVASASSCSHADSPGLVAPNNDCNEHACSAYVQAPPTPQCDATGNFCHVNASLDFSLVVTMAATSQFAPGDGRNGQIHGSGSILATHAPDQFRRRQNLSNGNRVEPYGRRGRHLGREREPSEALGEEPRVPSILADTSQEIE